MYYPAPFSTFSLPGNGTHFNFRACALYGFSLGRWASVGDTYEGFVHTRYMDMLDCWYSHHLRKVLKTCNVIYITYNPFHLFSCD